MATDLEREQKTEEGAPPLLSSLEVRGFRGMEHLSIPRLGRVNLFVGKNGTGKTSLLEAIRILAAQGNPRVLLETLGRDGLAPISRQSPDVDAIDQALGNLFFEAEERHTNQFELLAGESAYPSVQICQTEVYMNERGEETIGSNVVGSHAIRVTTGERTRVNIPLSLIGQAAWKQEVRPSVFITSHGIPSVLLEKLWDNVALTESENSVLDGLRILNPDVERLSLVNDLARTGKRVARVKLRRQRDPVALARLGEGINRVFGLMLSLVNSQRGILLIDEVENGLHYSVQGEMWETIFSLAETLDVQVFATTHSWDCLVGFQRAADAEPNVEGMVHRLELAVDGTHKVVDISEEDLAIVTRNQIEIR